MAGSAAFRNGKAGAALALLVSCSLQGNSAFTPSPTRSPPRTLTAITCATPPLHRRELLLLSSISGALGPRLSAKGGGEGGNTAKKNKEKDCMMSIPTTPFRVCVVGAGSISREFALHHFGPSTQTVVSSIVDINEERALSLAADVGSAQAGAAIENSGGSAYSATTTEKRGKPVSHSTKLAPCLEACDIVYIGTPPNSHAPLVLEALAAGKSVLLEKPLAATLGDADAIVSAAEHAQVVGLDIGMRWNPALAEMRRRAVVKSELGSLRAARLTLAFAQWPRQWQVQPWCAGRAEGGPLREVGTHFFFGLMELFGEGCVRRVKAEVRYKEGDSTGSEVSAQGVMELGDKAGAAQGLEIALDVRTDSKVGDVYELEVVGDKGSLMLKDFCRLKRTAPTEQWLVRDGSYGRVESVLTLIDAMRAPEQSKAKSRTGAEKGSAYISARQGRNAQRLLDAVVASHGQWLDVEYD